MFIFIGIYFENKIVLLLYLKWCLIYFKIKFGLLENCRKILKFIKEWK